MVELRAYPPEDVPLQYVVDKSDSYHSNAKPGNFIVRSEIEHSHFTPGPLYVLDEEFVSAFGQKF